MIRATELELAWKIVFGEEIVVGAGEFGECLVLSKHRADVGAEDFVAREDVPIYVPFFDIDQEVGSVGYSVYHHSGSGGMGGVDAGLDVFDLAEDI